MLQSQIDNYITQACGIFIVLRKSKYNNGSCYNCLSHTTGLRKITKVAQQVWVKLSTSHFGGYVVPL